MTHQDGQRAFFVPKSKHVGYVFGIACRSALFARRSVSQVGRDVLLRGVCARYGASKSAQLRFRFVKWNMASFFGILLVLGIIAVASTPIYVNVLFEVRFWKIERN